MLFSAFYFTLMLVLIIKIGPNTSPF